MLIGSRWSELTITTSVFFLAFILFSSLALGVATTWFIVRHSKNRMYWTLTPIYGLVWLIVGAPLFGVGIYLLKGAPLAPFVPNIPVPAQSPPVPATPDDPPVSLSEDGSEAESTPYGDAATSGDES